MSKRDWLSHTGTKILLLLLVFSSSENIFLYFKSRKLENFAKILISQSGKTPTEAKAGEQFPQISLLNLNGEENPNALQKDQIIFVFSTGCPACQKNFNNWQDIETHVGRENLIYLSASSPEETRFYAQEKKISAPVFMFKKREDQVRLKIFRVPQTILVKGGQIASIYPGILTKPQIEEIENFSKGSTPSKSSEVANSKEGQKFTETCNE